MIVQDSYCGIALTTPGLNIPAILSCGFCFSNKLSRPTNILLDISSYTGDVKNKLELLEKAAKKGALPFSQELAFQDIHLRSPYFDELFALFTISPDNNIKKYDPKDLFLVLANLSEKYVFVGHNLYNFVKTMLENVAIACSFRYDPVVRKVLSAISKGIDTCLLQDLLLSGLDVQELFDKELPHNVLKKLGQYRYGTDLKSCLDFYEIKDCELITCSGRAQASAKLYSAQKEKYLKFYVG